MEKKPTSSSKIKEYKVSLKKFSNRIDGDLKVDRVYKKTS